VSTAIFKRQRLGARRGELERAIGRAQRLGVGGSRLAAGGDQVVLRPAELLPGLGEGRRELDRALEIEDRLMGDAAPSGERLLRLGVEPEGLGR
jgi:hypothetical protein